MAHRMFIGQFLEGNKMAPQKTQNGGYLRMRKF